MGLAKLKCQNCGSSEVIEYKRNNFVCKYCSSTFRWVDPARSTVTIEHGYCNCGARAEFRCSDCNNYLCNAHSHSLADKIGIEARYYFLQNILPLLKGENISESINTVYCVECFPNAVGEMLGQIAELREKSKICKAEDCFSKELVKCENCMEMNYCEQHTPFRTRVEARQTGVFKKKTKERSVGFQRICEDCCNKSMNSGPVKWK